MLAFFSLIAVLLACKSTPPTDSKLGEQVKLEDSQWEVVSAKNVGAELEGFTGKKTTQGKFVKLDFKVTNLGKKDEAILDHPKLVDDQGREFGPMDDQSLFFSEPEKSITLESLPPNIMKRFAALYELPPDSKGLRFEARALSAFGDKKKITLGI